MTDEVLQFGRHGDDDGRRLGAHSDDLGSSADLTMFEGIPNYSGLPDSDGSMSQDLIEASVALVDPYHRITSFYNDSNPPWVGIAPAQACIGRPAHLDSVNIGSANPRAFERSYSSGYLPSSDCGLAASGAIHRSDDSAYGTASVKMSIAPGSEHDEPMNLNPAVSSLAFNEQEGDMRPELLTGSWDRQKQVSVETESSVPQPNRMECPDCKMVLRTNSELNKHINRHYRPHICDVPGCTWKTGFSTSNDLARHKRSLHPKVGSSGPRYQCSLGTCSTKSKIWPRADNFKAHLHRVHKKDYTSEELREFEYRPPSHDAILAGVSTSFSPHSAYGSSLSHHDVKESHQVAHLIDPSLDTQIGLAGDPLPSQTHLVAGIEGPPCQLNADEQSLDMADTISLVDSPHDGPMWTRISSISGLPDHLPRNSATEQPAISDDTPCQPRFIRGSNLSRPSDTVRNLSATSKSLGVPSGNLSQSQTNYVDTLPGAPSTGTKRVRSTSEASNKNSHVQAKALQVKQPTSGHDTPERMDDSKLALNLNDPTNVQRIIAALKENGFLQDLTATGKQHPIAHGDGSTTIGVASATHVELPYSCPEEECTKSFARRCELKKHEKRHRKPYGCTFGKCVKKFGSKNDWKRHENSQHIILEVWKCQQMDTRMPTEQCHRVFYRRDQADQHLKKDHGIDTATAKIALEQSRVGRNCESRFWCGFCQTIRQVEQKSHHAWTERFNHIEDHLLGRAGASQKTIEDWKSIDPDAPDSPDAAETDSDQDECGSTTSTASSKQHQDRGDLPEAPGRLSSKREAPEAETHRRSKKHRSRQAVMDTKQCCECGEYIVSNTSVCCTGFNCQHLLCSRCK